MRDINGILSDFQQNYSAGVPWPDEQESEDLIAYFERAARSGNLGALVKLAYLLYYDALQLTEGLLQDVFALLNAAGDDLPAIHLKASIWQDIPIPVEDANYAVTSF